MYRFLIACVALALMGGPCLAAPIEVYGSLPAMETVTISPDGKTLAYIGLAKGQRNVIVLDIATDRVLGTVTADAHKIRAILWADNENVVIITSQYTSLGGVITATKRSEWSVGYIFNTKARKVKPLISGDVGDIKPVLVGRTVARKVNGAAMVYTQSMAFHAGYGRNSVFRTDVAKGKTTILEVGELGTDDWLIDRNGVVVATSEFVERTGAVRLKLRRDGKMRVIEVPEGYEYASLAGLGRNQNTVLVSYWQGEKQSYAEISLETYEWSKPITDEAVEWLYAEPFTDAFLGYGSLVGDDRKETLFDPADQKTFRMLRAAFPGQTIAVESWSADRRRVVLRVDSPAEGPAFALYDQDSRTADWLGEAYENLNPADISPVRPISYSAADGLTITGYLTVPQGVEAKNLPLVVLPHGGPAARDIPGFDYWSQALASRGYAVLQPNFRGSDGFGKTFLEAGYGEWGKKMQTDLSDGVRHLAEKGVIDPTRVCIAGASYGGYAALAGATIDRGVYRCAVSVAGPSDLKQMLKTDLRSSGKSALRYWSRFMGVDGVKDPDLGTISPASQAAKAEVPILLIHGKDDSVVLYEQSQIMADALKKAGKPVEFVTLPGEDHWLSNGETRQQMLQSLVTFLEKHNPPNPAQTQTASAP